MQNVIDQTKYNLRVRHNRTRKEEVEKGNHHAINKTMKVKLYWQNIF